MPRTKPFNYPSFRAWTGGSNPKPLLGLDGDERALVSKLFRDQFILYFTFWKDKPTRDTLRIFWRRARYDAHATFRM